MPNYVQEASKKLNHQQKVFPQHSSQKQLPIRHDVNGSQQLHVKPKNNNLIANIKSKDAKYIVGTSKYYARAIDNTILASLSEIATIQAKPTEHTEEEYQQLQDCAATYPNVHIRYHASGMVL